MKISYVSDLHLEFHSNIDKLKSTDEGDILIIAGDLVPAKYILPNMTDPESRGIKKNLKSKLKKLCKRYTHTFYVMGNHEHYHSNFIETPRILSEFFIEHDLPVKLFNNHYEIVNDWLFIGSTLWTDFNKNDSDKMSFIWNYMNDYRLIGNGTGPFSPYVSQKITPEFTYNEHIKSMKFIKSILDFYSHNVFIFTHMCPTLQSINYERGGNDADYAYASDLKEFITNNPRIKYWVHGHTHKNFDYMVGGCRVLANQRGYPSEPSFNEFKGLAHIEI